MRGLFHVRLVNVLGTVGAMLGAIGFFLPYRTEIVTGTAIGMFASPYPAGTVLTDSFWGMLVNTIQSGGTALYFPWPMESLLIGVFILSILFPLGTFLGALLGNQKRIFLYFSLLLATLGLLEFLIYSAVLFLLFAADAARTAEPGFWFMFIGFPLSIGSTLKELF